MNKADAEDAIRDLARAWASGNGIALPSDAPVSFSQFKSWLSASGYSHVLRFRSTTGPEYDAEVWFDDEMKQLWRR